MHIYKCFTGEVLTIFLGVKPIVRNYISSLSKIEYDSQILSKYLNYACKFSQNKEQLYKLLKASNKYMNKTSTTYQ